MQTISDRLRSSANMCTRVNAAVTLLCENAFIAANELERVTKQRDEAIAELHVIESIINGESITTDAGYDTYRRANFIRRTFEKLDRAQAEIRALESKLLEES